MRRSLSVSIPQKTDAFSRIKVYMSEPDSGIVLVTKEEQMLKRMVFADRFLSENKYTVDEVAEKLKDLFGISIWTAKDDIKKTYTLFAGVTEDYKRYAMRHHVEFLNKKISQWENDKSMAPFLPKLIAEKTRALAALPVQAEAPDVPPPVIIVNVTANIIAPMDAGDALSQADKLIEFEKEHEYLEFEETPDDERKQ
jgi:hypothetical protein